MSFIGKTFLVEMPPSGKLSDAELEKRALAEVPFRVRVYSPLTEIADAEFADGFHISMTKDFIENGCREL